MNRARVGDIAEQVRGVSYAKPDVSKTFSSDLVPLLRADNVTDEGLVFEDIIYVKPEHVSPNQRLRRGDIVVAASSGSISVVGKAAQLLRDFNGTFGAFCKVVRPGPRVPSLKYAAA